MASTETQLSFEFWYKALLALVLWREAQGEPHEGRVAIANVIRNRVLSTHHDDQWDNVMEKKWQFSSLTAPGDPTLVRWPDNTDPVFQDCARIAIATIEGTIEDNTGGATLYANLNVCDPAWTHTATKTVVIGHHTFFKE